MELKIFEIIHKGYESKHWDFKREWHDNNVDLVHDILCLANNETSEDSYLIFGVEDDGNICGTKTRKKLADLVDILRNASDFYEGNIPNIDLQTYTYGDDTIDVLIVYSTKQTPYFLNSDFSFQGKRLKSGHIYSRTNDRNTPKDKQADPNIIEQLWRKRFGIDLTVQEKLKHLLLEINEWKSFHGNDPKNALMNYENVVHNYFPEYRLEVQVYEDSHHGSYTTEGYCKFYPDPVVGRFPINIFYNSTKIKEVQFMTVDGSRELILQPRLGHFNFENIHDSIGYYYYLKDSTEWLLFGLISENRFEVTTARTKYLKNNNGDWSIAFENEQEKEKFEEWARPKFDEEKKKHHKISIAIPEPKNTIPAYDSDNMMTIKSLFNQYKML